MRRIRLVNSVPMTLNMTPMTSNIGGIRTAQSEVMSGSPNAKPRMVSTTRKAVPYRAARVPAHRYSPATTSSTLIGVVMMASYILLISNLTKVLKVLSNDAANMALLARSPGAMYWVYVSPFMAPSRMNAPSPSPRAARYNNGSKRFG